MNLNFNQKGKGETTLLFIHGNSSSLTSYVHQFDSQLKDIFLLHAVDLPGHGHSPKADDINTYSIPGYANALLEHIDQIKLKNIVLVGWSLGGHIALEMVAKSDQFKGLVIFGTPPLGTPPAMEQAFLENEAVNIGFNKDVDEVAALAYATSFFKANSSIDVSQFVEDIMKTDGDARANLVPSMSSIGYEDEVKIVSNLAIPTMIIHGKQEQLVNGEYLESLTIPSLFDAEIKYIDDAGHAPQFETPEIFNSLLKSFVDYTI